MKKLYSIIAAVCLTASIFAQAPEKMSYQAVVRNSSDEIVSGHTVGMKISILKGGETGTEVYVETQTPSTNSFGLVSIEVGGGTLVSGDFTSIDWSIDTYYIKTEFDLSGGTSYSVTGTSQLLSVPYALHSKTTNNVLEKDNTTAFTPNADYEPATKKYVDDNAATTHSYGDFVNGGIVVYLENGGQNGIVMTRHNVDSVRWNAGTNGATRAYGKGIYDGEMNTPIIIAAQVAIGDDGTTYAARVCAEYTEVLAGTDYSGWYLPAEDELKRIFTDVLSLTNQGLSDNGGAPFKTYTDYWTSTESTIDNANARFVNYIGSGGNPAIAYSGSKADVKYIRCFRRF